MEFGGDVFDRRHLSIIGSILGITLISIVLSVVPRPALAQFDVPASPASPETLVPVPLKRELDVAPDEPRIRILVIGDVGVRDGGWSGTSDLARRRVAARARTVCSENRCDLAVLLGDNLYDKGIRKRQQAEDEEALERIVRSFLADPEMPVYLVLGNHDWGPRLPRHSTADRQLRWVGATTEPDIRGNAHFYDLRAGPVALWVLDSDPLVKKGSANRDPDLLAWLDGLQESEAQWKIVATHHPMRSNGEHGNPGNYREPPIPFSIWPGKGYRKLLDSKVEGVADLVIAGHEHNLQFMSEVAIDRLSGTAAAIIGSGAKCTGPGKRRFNADMEFEIYNYGFAVVDATESELSITFHVASAAGWNLWTASRRRDSGWSFATPDETGRPRSCKEDDSCCPMPREDRQ